MTLIYTRLLLCLLLLLGCDSCTEEKTPRVWQKYRSPDQKFEILMPVGSDTGSAVFVDSLFGNLREYYREWRFSKPYHISFVESTDIKSIEFSFIDLPATHPKVDPNILVRSVRGHITQHADKFVKFLVPVKDIRLNGYPGMYFVEEIDAGKSVNRICYVKRFLTPGRLYKLKVTAYKGQHRTGEVDSFFNSLMILN